MLLSEILKLEEDKISEAYFGIEVDEESFSPPPGLKQIGLEYKGDKGEIDETLMDVIISYALSGIEIILEIPEWAEEIDARYMMSVAANAGFSISLLPPEKDTPEAREAYNTRLIDFTDAYFGQVNFGRFVYPVTSFLEYMFIETVKPIDRFDPQDPYIRQRFVENTTEDFSDSFKAVLRERFYELHDGKDGFEKFAKAMMFKIYKQAQTNVADIIKSHSDAEPEGEEAPAE
ncbi:MAG: hypothetical protein Alpg2KO_28360 [Alphaproteobacteria bacterium]